MAIFATKKRGKTKDEKLPELPELPNFSDNSSWDQGAEFSRPHSPESSQIKNLPSFPDSEIGNSLSQEAVKSAVQPKRLTIEIPEPNFENINYIKTEPKRYPAQPKPPIMPLSAEKKDKGKEPVYIRVDKFKFAIDNFESIKQKISEVEKYLNKIREQKRKEYEELDEWEKEIEAIKLRIESVDNKIFSKL